MLLDGYACRHKMTSLGQRQIVSFHIPGDLLDAQQLELERRSLHSTITPTTVAWVSKRDMEKMLDGHPAIRKAIIRGMLVLDHEAGGEQISQETSPQRINSRRG